MSTTYDSMAVGDSFSLTRVITPDEMRAFADLTGDDNPLHVDPEYAKDTRFGKPVVHGVFLLAVFSKILGHDFPGGGTIAVSLFGRYVHPAPVNAEIKFRVKVIEKIEKRKQVKARVRAYHDNKIILEGEALMIPPTDGESPLI